ncbi:MFS transporter [Paenibacillus sp. OV219]|uniref:MFS transporter n=1 Tax=Paenibacillus sp. OV219 TaxID=1884377 RepID=UPI0008AFF0C4|nr:MFS transporter [Paenibacillus sp. OV219]SEN49270.1 glycoside/pentoside/hexuronide:cation symporter, GPH family [Paenibacillus sp. OV219]
MSNIEKPANRELTGWQKFFLSFPTMPGNLSVVLIHNAFLKYYTDIIGLNPKFVGLIYAIFGIWNAINDPAIGVWLDRHKYNEKKGKYVYIMRLCAPVTLFATFAMIFAQPSWNEWVIFAFLLVFLFIYDTTMTTFSIAHANYKLIAAKTNKERVDVAVITTYVANIGGFLGTVIPTLLLVGNHDKNLTILLFCAVLAVNSILYFVALKPLKETREMYLKENVQTEDRKGVFGDVLANVRDALKSRSFVTLVLFQILAIGPCAFYFTPFLYMSDYVLNLEGYQATIMDLSMGFSLFVTAPLWGIWIKKLGMKTSVMWALIPCALGFFLLTFVQNFFQTIVAYIIMYVFAQAISIAMSPMMGAIIDEDEQRTGQRKAGMFNGLDALLTIPVSGIQASLFMGIISYFGFQAGSKIQSDHALMGIKLGAGALPFVFLLLGIIPLLYFPINKKKEQELSEFSKNRQMELDSP